jgi:hypothetical protein
LINPELLDFCRRTNYAVEETVVTQTSTYPTNARKPLIAKPGTIHFTSEQHEIATSSANLTIDIINLTQFSLLRVHLMGGG